VLEGTLSASKFVDTSRLLTGTIENIPQDILEKSFKEFVKVLENYMGNKNFEKLKSKDIVQDFLSTDLKLYKGVEITVHCICAAAVKLSVESDVESLVSRYEKHLKVDRQLEEENAEDEMEISENGPLLQNADKILKQAMNAYWKETTQSGEWHFIRRKEEIVSSNSKVIDRLLKKKSKFGFMDK
jgi:hypothetical protein